MFITYATMLGFGVLLLLTDLFVGIGLGVRLISAFQLAAIGTETTGKVTRIETRQPGWRARVEVAYETPEGWSMTTGYSHRPRIGEPMPVRYHPARPRMRATTVTQPWPQTIVAIPTVLLVAAVGYGMTAGAVWYFTGTHTALQIPVGDGAFCLGCALVPGYYAATRYLILLQWRRMVSAEGTVGRYHEKSPAGPAYLISFQCSNGHEEFWVPADNVRAEESGLVTVYYDPEKPATTATVDTAEDVRHAAIASTVFALTLGSIAMCAIMLL